MKKIVVEISKDRVKIAYDFLTDYGLGSSTYVELAKVTNSSEQVQLFDWVNKASRGEILPVIPPSEGTALGYFIGISSNFFMGIGDAVVNTAIGLWETVTNFNRTLEGVAFLAKAQTPGSEENKLLTLIIAESVSKCWNDFSEGDDNRKARMIGRAVGEILLAFMGVEELSIALDAIKISAKCGELGNLLSKIGKGLKTGNEVVAILKRMAEAVAKAHNYIVNAIDDALTEFRKIIRSGDYYEVEFVDPFGNIIKERVPFNEIDQTYFSKIDEAAGFTNKIEQVLDKMQTYEQARNKALEIVGDLGYDSKPYVGRLGTGEGKIVGRQSADGKVRWRLDYDPEKGPHINVEDFRNGKGSSATKIAIPFEGDINTIETLLNVLNQ